MFPLQSESYGIPGTSIYAGEIPVEGVVDAVFLPPSPLLDPLTVLMLTTAVSFIVVVVVVAFSSLVRILGECSNIHSLPALF